MADLVGTLGFVAWVGGTLIILGFTGNPLSDSTPFFIVGGVLILSRFAMQIRDTLEGIRANKAILQRIHGKRSD